MSTIGTLKAVWSDPVLSSETYINVDSHWTVAETVRNVYHDTAITANKENSPDDLGTVMSLPSLSSFLITSLAEAKKETGVKESGVKGVEATKSGHDAPAEPPSLEKLWERMKKMEADRGVEKVQLQERIQRLEDTVTKLERTIARRIIARQERIIARQERTIVGLKATVMKHECTIVGLKATATKHEHAITGLKATVARHEHTMETRDNTIAQQEIITRSLRDELGSVRAEHQDQMQSLRQLTMMLIPLHLRPPSPSPFGPVSQ
ncbi:hypothetical protein BU15DRAFT_78778 [Melanogaster broomeanus]|nr:hypothetical protein BU15DRAFT_78778 [Melanogaster broomeanus]